MGLGRRFVLDHVGQSTPAVAPGGCLGGHLVRDHCAANCGFCVVIASAEELGPWVRFLGPALAHRGLRHCRVERGGRSRPLRLGRGAAAGCLIRLLLQPGGSGVTWGLRRQSSLSRLPRSFSKRAHFIALRRLERGLLRKEGGALANVGGIAFDSGLGLRRGLGPAAAAEETPEDAPTALPFRGVGGRCVGEDRRVRMRRGIERRARLNHHFRFEARRRVGFDRKGRGGVGERRQFRRKRRLGFVGIRSAGGPCAHGIERVWLDIGPSGRSVVLRRGNGVRRVGGREREGDRLGRCLIVGIFSSGLFGAPGG